MRRYWPICGVAGCSNKTKALAKDLKNLQHEVSRLRSANLAMQDRLDAIELSPNAGPATDNSEQDDPNDRPVLEVVRLSPEEPGEPEILIAPAPDDGPRPVIKGDNSSVEQFSDEQAAVEAAEAKVKKQQSKLPYWKRGKR